MITGIYKISNLTTNKIYIGSSVHCPKRWSVHKNELNHNKHHSPLLQRSWNKYGAEGFRFEVIEECPKENLIEREQFWLDFYQSYKPENGFNLRKIADRNIGVTSWNKDSWKEKVSEIDLVRHYSEGNTLKECSQKFGISIDSVTLVVKQNNVLRTKSQARKVRDQFHPELSKQHGILLRGVLVGEKNPQFGKKGYWLGKQIPIETHIKATQTRSNKYGDYFSAQGLETISKVLETGRGFRHGN